MSSPSGEEPVRGSAPVAPRPGGPARSRREVIDAERRARARHRVAERTQASLEGRRPRRRQRVPRIVPLSLLVAAVVGLSGVGAQLLAGRDDGSVRVDVPAALDAPTGALTPAARPSGTPTSTLDGESEDGTVGQASPSGTASATPSGSLSTPAPTPSVAAGLTPDDVAAGLLSTAFTDEGSGTLVTVPGGRAAPGRGPVHTFRVQVEKGLPIDGAAFADFVFETLNAPKGWAADGAMTFRRVDGPSDLRVVLASPDTSAQMCRPLRTGGTLSCRNGDAAVLTVYRWVKGTPDYGSNRLDYRRYLVSHEVGHWLGHGHVTCPGKGRRAPVMMQQTKGLDGCAQNPWPNP